MAMVEQTLARTGYPAERSSLVDVVDLILDKGLVLDAFVRVSVIGIELLTLDARIVIASIDTYLRFAEAVNRLDLTQTKESTTYEDLVKQGSGDAAKSGTEGALEGAKEELKPRRHRKEGDGQGNSERSRNPGGEDEDESGESGSRSAGSQGGGERKSVLGRLSDRGRWS